MRKKDLSEADIITKFILPAIEKSGWDNMTQLKSAPFYIPPLAEQHRIVAKVDELMALCDQLKTRLSESQQTQLYLTDAIVEQSVSV